MVGANLKKEEEEGRKEKKKTRWLGPLTVRGSLGAAQCPSTLGLLRASWFGLTRNAVQLGSQQDHRAGVSRPSAQVGPFSPQT